MSLLQSETKVVDCGGVRENGPMDSLLVQKDKISILLVTLAALSKARTVFGRPNTGSWVRIPLRKLIVNWNRSQG
jgi:hypothetical protein